MNDTTEQGWRKRCHANNACVEWLIAPEHVLVRDSTDGHGSAVHVFTRDEFARFVRALKAAP